MANINEKSVAIYAPAVFLSLIFSIVIIKYDLVLVFGLLLTFSAIFLMFRWPELGTLVVIFIIYTNIPVIATKVYKMPQLLASSVVLLLFIPLAHHIFIRREKFIVDTIFLVMLLFLFILVLSSLSSKDASIALDWIVTYIQEGIILYFLIVNVIRSFMTLKRVIWALMLAGSLMGSISLYQELTQSYDNSFGGLSSKDAAKLKKWKTEKSDYAYEHTGLAATRSKVYGVKRAEGAIGEKNRFAQIMMVLLPFAFSGLWGERSRRVQIGSIVAGSLILSGVLLSYSRGAFLTLVLLLLLVVCMRYVRLYQIVVSIAVLFLLMTVIAPGYFARVDTIRSVVGLFSDEAEVKPDGAVRGRMTEMLAALKVFLDYPILGVGPGQYAPFYSERYHLDSDIAFRHLPEPRRAHSLYFELAAEVGLVGITIFMTAVCLVMARLWGMRRRWLYMRSDLANLATAFVLSFIAYLGTAMFLHFSYQRYYWLLLALGGAALQVFRAELSQVDRQEGP